MEYINNSIGIEVPLDRKIDADGKFYYVGKLQFNGAIDLNGTVFMVFKSDPGYEMLQISCLADKPNIKKANVNFGNRITVSLEGFKDSEKQIVYKAEVLEDRVLQLRGGIFFTIFTSIAGKEEIQITPLRQHFNKERKVS